VIRREINELVAMGPLPDSRSDAADEERLNEYQRRLERISPPVSDDEALALARLFGPDDCFGAAWTLLHLIETAPNWPLVERLPRNDSQWIERLRLRAERASNTTRDP
jgi:hypothetical protein